MSSGWVNSSEPVPNLSTTQGTRLAVEQPVINDGLLLVRPLPGMVV